MLSVVKLKRFYQLATLSGLSQRAVARSIGRSPKLVRSCVRRGIDNRPGTSTGRKRVLDEPTVVRQIRRHASNTQVTSSNTQV